MLRCLVLYLLLLVIVAEYNFVYLFTGLISESDIMAYMLMWRLVTYYIPLIVGGLIAITWKKVKHNYE